MKKIFFTFLICFLSLGAMTAQEAETIYRDNHCKMVSETNGVKCFKCDLSPAPECAVPIEWDNITGTPACVPEWCNAPLIKCGQTPIAGVDSCGDVCTKPSAQWPNCIP